MGRLYTQTEFNKIVAVYRNIQQNNIAAANAIVDAMTDKEFEALVASAEALENAALRFRAAHGEHTKLPP